MMTAYVYEVKSTTPEAIIIEIYRDREKVHRFTMIRGTRLRSSSPESLKSFTKRAEAKANLWIEEQKCLDNWEKSLTE